MKELDCFGKHGKTSGQRIGSLEKTRPLPWLAVKGLLCAAGPVWFCFGLVCGLRRLAQCIVSSSSCPH